jgi:hypothetical protein
MLDVNDKKAHHLLQHPFGLLTSQFLSQVLAIRGLQAGDSLRRWTR